jgi:hypothetical protein
MRVRVAAAVLVAILVAALVVAGPRTGRQLATSPASVAESAAQSAAPSADPVRADQIVNVIPQDAKTALVGSASLPASEASEIQPSELVIGVVINSDARTFPLAILNVHEVVDDVIGGQPVAITW